MTCNEFLHCLLQMVCTLRLKHLYSTWLMLVIERAMRLDAQNQVSCFICYFLRKILTERVILLEKDQ